MRDKKDADACRRADELKRRVKEESDSSFVDDVDKVNSNLQRGIGLRSKQPLVAR